MITRRLALAAVAAATLAVSTACGGSTPAGSGGSRAMGSGTVAATPGPGTTQQVSIDATNMLRFQPMTIKAKVGALRITLSDQGAYPHDISFPTLHVTSKTVTGDPGQQQTVVTVHPSRAGSYPFVCTFHDSAGMKGTLEVT